MVDFVRWAWPKSLPIDLFDFRSMTFFVECQFFRLDRRCPLGGGVGVELLKWDFGSRLYRLAYANEMANTRFECDNMSN